MTRVRITDTPSVPCGYLLQADDGRDKIVQLDYDYPRLASNLFGWEPCHRATDGTIDCPVCGTNALTLINRARACIDEHEGEWVEDPGYFS